MGVSRSHLAAAALLAAALFGPQERFAQAGGPEPYTDSAGIHADARKAQARFERTRALRLPWTFAEPGRPCQEHVGRYCVWHDRTDDDWVAPPEHRDVGEARDALLIALRDALKHHPGDEWIVGQRAAYLLDAGRAADALDVARACQAVSWWCAAVTGFVHHARGETEEAERQFERALRSMPPDERSAWMDPSSVLSSRDERRFEALAPPARDSVAARLWWLADPLWMRAGNDRWTEHLVRVIRARLARNAGNVEGIRWAKDMEELLLRFGWPAGWERYSSGSLERRVGILTHRAAFGREFVPSLEMAASPERIEPGDWDLTPRIPVTEYAPDHARFEGALALQLAVLPDGDSAVVAAAFAFDHDSVAPDDSLEAALVAATLAGAVMDSAAGVARRTVLLLRVPQRDLVASVEAVAGRALPRAARVRMGLPLARRDSLPIALSDPLLIGAESLVASRTGAVRHMLVPSEIARADSIGVYLEASRLAPDVPVEVELTLEPEPSRGLRRLGESIGLVSRRSAVRLAWQEHPPADGRLTRAVSLGFANVPPGRYMLRVLVRQGAAIGSSAAGIRRSR